MKTRNLKQIEKEYQLESNKLISMAANPGININEFNEQKKKVDSLWREYLRLQGRVTKMKGGKR